MTASDIEEVAQKARSMAFLASVEPERLEDPRCAFALGLRTGRPPMLGDEVPPWRYRGWLRLLVQQLHALAQQQTGFPDRWGYLFEIITNRRLPAEPIPRVDFDTPAPTVLKATDAWVSILDAHNQWTSFRDFVRFLAWGLAVGKHGDPMLGDGESEALYRTVNLGLWLRDPSDYLGEVAAIRYGGGPHKFFPTPHPVCEVLLAARPEGDCRAKSVNDPAMGTGRLLLHASNYFLRLSGQDIDEIMHLCTLVNLAVYAPWGLADLSFLEGVEAATFDWSLGGTLV